MSATNPRKVPCPQCGALSVWSTNNPYRPFCSERCKMLDLGAWANEQYKIAGEAIDEANDLDDER